MGQTSGQTDTVSDLLRAWGRGDSQAREDLVPIVYRELRRRAGAYLRRERPGHTLQPTALVHEAYVRLMGQDRVAWQNRATLLRDRRADDAPHSGRPRART